MLSLLNSIASITAENSLSQTQASLDKALNQLSTGLRVNSGVDDAAGLSIADGLQANIQALTQSNQNASDGIGLLQTADGALSQVSALLDRATTLATEAANGGLSSSQQTALNNEFQSILTEINQIGSTTNFNGENVFSGGSSIALNDGGTALTAAIDPTQTLSGGFTVTYTPVSGGSAGDVFIDLSKGGSEAALGDALGGASTTLNVTTVSGGSQVTTPITVSGANNTISGLINAIDSAGLTATLGTSTMAGAAAVMAAGNGTDEGIIITGASSAVFGTNAGGTGNLGSLSVAASSDTLTGTLNVTDSSGNNHVITLGQAGTTDTLADLATTINGAGYGISAQLQGGNTQLQFFSSSASASVSGSNLEDVPTLTVVQSTTLMSITVAASGDALSGKFSVAMPNGLGGYTQHSMISLGAGNGTGTLAGLQNYFATGPGSSWGVTATLSNGGKTLTFTVPPGSGAYSMGEISIDDNGAPATIVQSPLASLAVNGANDTFTAGTLSGMNSGFSPWSLNIAGMTEAQLVANLAGKGITATYNAGQLKFTTAFSNDNPLIAGSGIVDGASGAPSPIGWVPGPMPVYNTGITGSVTDTVTGGGTGNVAITADATSGAGMSPTNYAVSIAGLNAANLASSILAQLGGVGGDFTVSYNAGTGALNIGLSANGAGGSISYSSNTTMEAPAGGNTNAIYLSDGTANGASNVSTNVATLSSSGLGLGSDNLSSASLAATALGHVTTAINTVSSQRGTIGATVNQLSAGSQVMNTEVQNLTTAQNKIQNADIGKTIAEMSQYNVLESTGMAAIQQSEQAERAVLKLLQ